MKRKIPPPPATYPFFRTVTGNKLLRNLGLIMFPHLLLECLPHLHDTSSFDVVWQLEGWLLDTTLTLQVLPLKAPMAGHWHRVPRRLECTNKVLHYTERSMSANILGMNYNYFTCGLKSYIFLNLIERSMCLDIMVGL